MTPPLPPSQLGCATCDVTLSLDNHPAVACAQIACFVDAHRHPAAARITFTMAARPATG